MVKTKLKLFEIAALSEEIHGLQDRNTGNKIQKGLLDEELTLVQKYWLTDFGKKAKEITDEVEPLRNEIITKYGEDSGDGQIGISATTKLKNEAGEVIGEVPNPKWNEFNTQYGELMDQEKEVEHQEFQLNDFGFKSENRYSIFLNKLIKA